MKTYDVEITAEELERREARLDEVKAVLGYEAAEAMNEFLSVIDKNFYIWLANLYDRETGGLYYSLSAKHNEGYLPDLESTPRGWGWLIGSGMLENYDHDLAKALPEWLKEKLLNWVIPMQSPKDGYFYHPQWGGTENLSRLGRDLDCATLFIKRLGGQQLYDGMNGTKGVLGAPSDMKNLSNKDRTDLDEKIAHLRSPEAFEEYLDSLDWDNRSYGNGNLLESQATQIRSLGDDFVRTYERYLNGRQERIQNMLESQGRKKNGIWQIEVGYTSVNGLMKISSTYTRLGIAIPYIEEAFESALSMVYLTGNDFYGETASAVVNIFNPWVAMDHLIENAEKFGDPALAEKLRKKLRDNAPALIRATTEKFKKFKRPDGSFAYNAVGGQHLSQRMPVSVPGVDEGDVNGATIAVSAILGHMCATFGVKKPQLFFASDFERFMKIIEAQR